jgi:chromosome partitioning ATPase, parA family|nr:MAG TPA: ParA [Caudoviricetes sp.]
MGKVISIINMKGGVGKTTLSIGISDYLAEIGKKVLLIDADPQFNATQTMLDLYKDNTSSESDENEDNYYNTDILPKRKTIYSLFEQIISLNSIYETPSSESLIINLKQNLDMLCGDLTLVLVANSGEHGLVRRISNFIEDNKLKEQYDYIIIDCPPTISIYTESSLSASDYYLIPNKIDRYSIIGIDSLQRAVAKLVKEERLTLKCIGLVYTMVSDSVKQKNLRANFENKKKFSNIDIFTAQTTTENNIQYGAAGANPNKYKKSRTDIESVSLELIKRIEEDITSCTQS